jgi:cytochrome b561
MLSSQQHTPHPPVSGHVEVAIGRAFVPRPQVSVRFPGERVGKHPALTIALHWGTFAAIVIAVAAMFARDAIEDKFWRVVLLNVHRQLGLLVLVALGLRLAVRLRHGMRNHAGDMSRWVRWAAQGAHVGLYGLLFALPVGGWALTSAHGIPLALLGVIHLPSLVGADSDLADNLGDYHIWLAWGLLAVVGLHAAAALWHHFVRRDDVLRAMLPGRSRGR